jgi:hypothetical protein
MKAHARVEVQLHAFLTSSLDEGDWTSSRYGHLLPVKGPSVVLHMTLSGPQSTEKSLPIPEIQSCFFNSPVGSPAHYTDWAFVAANLRKVDFVTDFSTVSTNS